MANWTTAQDVLDRWVGSGTPSDENLIETLLTDAEAVILAEFPRIQERITAETLSLDVVKFVSVRMVTRVLRNPEGLSYWQQNTGPFGQGRNYGDRVDIWLSDDERRLLAPSSSTRGKAFSVNQAPDARSGEYVSDAFDAWNTVDYLPGESD